MSGEQQNQNNEQMNKATETKPEGTTDEQSTTNAEGDVGELKELFTPDEIKAKQESVKTAKTEEERRSKLSKEELAAEDTKKAAEEAESKVPEEYGEFKIPKGMEMDKDMLAKATPLFKEMGLSQSKAQRLVDFYSETFGPAFVKQQAEKWEAQKEVWKSETKADKEIGGTKFDASVTDAVRVLNTLGTPELKKAFDDYGLGNHPEFVRVFARMAKHMKEDSIDDKNKETKIFDNMSEGEKWDKMANKLYDTK